MCIVELKSKSYAELCQLEAFVDDDHFLVRDRKVSVITAKEMNKNNEVMVAVEVHWQTTFIITMGATAWADGFAMNSEGVTRELTEEEYWALE